MTDMEAVISDLLSRLCGGATPPASRTASRMSPGTFRLDYGDCDHVFVLTLTQLPCRQLGPAGPLLIGHVDGLDVQLTAVVVDTHVHVDLDIPESARRAEMFRAYQASFERWAASLPNDVEPPAQPGDRLMTVAITVTDDIGTPYTFHSGRSGGSGTEWQARRSFVPVPPIGATSLKVSLRTSDDAVTATEFGL